MSHTDLPIPPGWCHLSAETPAPPQPVRGPALRSRTSFPFRQLHGAPSSPHCPSTPAHQCPTDRRATGLTPPQPSVCGCHLQDQSQRPDPSPPMQPPSRIPSGAPLGGCSEQALQGAPSAETPVHQRPPVYSRPAACRLFQKGCLASLNTHPNSPAPTHAAQRFLPDTERGRHKGGLC